MRFPLAALTSLALGALAVGLACEALGALAKPDLLLRLVDRGDNRLALRFVNVGGRDLRLDLDDLDWFLLPPADASRNCLVQVRPKSAKAPALVLRPGERVEVARFLPDLRRAPKEGCSVSAVYDARGGVGEEAWRGVARSLPISYTGTR